MAIEDNTRVPRPAHNYVPEYQQSGIPWVKTLTLPALNITNDGTANAVINNLSDYKVSFDFVTRWFLLHNHDDAQKTNIRIYFNETAASTARKNAVNQDTHYYLCDIEEVLPRLEMKCKEMYLIPSTSGKTPLVSIIAGLTNIRALDFPDQTYNNGFLGVEDNPDP